MVTDVCRLCLTKENLVWIFDKRLEKSENMKNVIFITTGVEVTMKDIISQKICKKCYEVTIKMYEFRKTSLASDKRLREESLHNLKESVRIPHTEVTIKSGIKKGVKAGPTQDTTDRTVFKIHPSVRDLFKVYPQIKLPTMCLKSHIAPFVSLPMDQVENYFKLRKLDFNECTKVALRSERVATKRAFNNHKAKMSKVTPTHNLDKHRIPPIKIVPDKGQKNFVISNRIENEHVTPERLPQEKKRKFDELEITSTKDNSKKPLFIESLGLTPKINVYPPTLTFESPAYVANMSVPLHICDICNSVQYSAKELKRHQYKHLTCQFCKTKFRTQEGKKDHIDNVCIIKKTMHNLPNIELEKIEYNLEIRKKYPMAFAEFFPPLEGITTSEESIQTRSDLEENQSIQANISQSERVEPIVIEILSDDEEPLLVAGGTTRRANNVSNAVNNSGVNAKISSNSTNLNTQRANIGNILYSTVSIVKPEIKIRDNTVLDKLDSRLSDVKILKELLNVKPMQAMESKLVQTELPANESIIINRNDSTIELRHLKEQLCVYKIPVVIKFGPLNVSYNYETESKQPKKLCLWNDLMPIDIKTNKTVISSSAQVSDLNINKNNIVLNTCTATTPIVNQISCVSNNQQKGSTNLTYVKSNSPTVFPARTPQLGSSPKFIRINKSSLISPPNIIDMNPLLNKYLHSSTSSAPTTSTSVTSTVTSTDVLSNTPVISSVDTPDSASNNASHGAIRVKNVWELT